MKKLLLLLLILSIIGLVSGVVSAGPPGVEFEITKSTIDNGGGTSTSGDGAFSLTGTIGQHDASPVTSVGGKFVLAGGFWAKASDTLLSDGFED